MCGHEMEILRSPQMCLLEQQPEIHIIDADFNEGEHGVYIMQTHKDPEARRRFEIVNGVLGWGNPRARIWFIGLEEAGKWDEDPNKDKEGYERYSKCIDGWMPVLEGEIEKQAEKDGKKYTKIYNIMSKLILQITRGGFTEWKSYRNKQLFVDACQTNLYPLARPHHNEWPKHYKCLFGFG